MNMNELRKLNIRVDEATTKKKLKSGAESLADDLLSDAYYKAKEMGWDDSSLSKEELTLFWQYCYKHLAKIAREKVKK